ncbi:MAG TPA: GLPGLI family protein [Bacteroidales bacterium]|nr:GLPGLI family protein [Bacteroidales bacterium]HQI71377.1 GLPGLI family protein [Bacteroidales bacterium]
MRKIFFTMAFLALAGVGFKSYGQQEPVKIKYLTTYNWVKMLNACDYLSKESKERTAYMWGNRSEWKMYSILYSSATHSRFEDSEERPDGDDDNYQGRKETFFMIHNFENQTYVHVLEMLGKTYLISDSLKMPDWKIKNDLKEVSGHVCMNAALKDTLRGQKIVAWFALDMPLQAGPDRFYGLPGMILEVDINNGAEVITAEKIEKVSLTNEFELPKKLKAKKISGTEYAAILKKFYDDKRKAEEFPWGVRY